MEDSIAILGRQPALGIAELESLYGPSTVEWLGDHAARIHVAACSIDAARLGGTMKLCKLLTNLDTADWRKIEQFLLQVSPGHAAQMQPGKMHLGLSVYGLPVSTQQLLATGLKIKKTIQKAGGRSVRLVPNKEAALNTAQVLHNKLTSPNGWELVFIRHGAKTIVAQTVHVQDIEGYSDRDFNRPKRDTRVGMLPPKVAQLLINLATGPAEFAAVKDTLSGDVCLSEADAQKMRAGRSSTRVLDPFCGTGVVLQEAALMGYGTCGTDLEPRMIDYTQANLAWLQERYPDRAIAPTLSQGDATTYRWEAPITMVASETYLGRPFTAPPANEALTHTVSDCNLIIKKFLRNIYGQLQPGTRLCLAVPAWQGKPGVFRYLPLIDQIDKLGYNQVRFERVQDTDLLYYRSDQIVARKLLVITRK